MYIESINISNFRTFREARIELSHSDRKPTRALPTPKLPNVNLLLGNNGLGKTTLLKAISLAALGPAVAGAGIYPYRLIRREPDENRSMGHIGESKRRQSEGVAHLKGHVQSASSGQRAGAHSAITDHDLPARRSGTTPLGARG